MTPDEFMAQQKGDALAYAQNLVAQRDDALARIAAFDAKYTTLQSDRANALAGKDQQLATLQGLIDAMGGTVVGQQLAHDKKRADAVKRKADADAASAAAAAEIATLDNPPKE